MGMPGESFLINNTINSNSDNLKCYNCKGVDITDQMFCIRISNDMRIGVMKVLNKLSRDKLFEFELTKSEVDTVELFLDKLEMM